MAKNLRGLAGFITDNHHEKISRQIFPHMKKVLLTGATGMVGGIVLQTCLASAEIAQVTSLVRRSSGIAHPKLKEVIHDDFSNYTGLEAHFEEIDAAYFCIGVYTGQVPNDQFKVITVDFTLAFADALKTHSPEATLCFLSGAGADPKEKSRTAFARYKGIAENYLLSKGFSQLYIFRPAYIYPVTPRKEPNLMYRVSRKLYPVLKAIYPAATITSVQLGQAMFQAGLTGAEQTILENEEIKKILQIDD